MSEDDKLCPSMPMDEDARLIGIVGNDGQIKYLGAPKPVSEKFIETASQGGDPGHRFRFAAPCMKEECQQWKNGGCSIANIAVESYEQTEFQLPKCGIRKECRWYYQRGIEACKVCSKVTTKTDNVAFEEVPAEVPRL